MEGYKLDILGIIECMQMDRSREIEDNIRTDVVYAGNERVHEGGVAILMSKRGERALVEWTSVSKRIITARFYSRFRRMSVIQVYALYNERDEKEKGYFYEELQQKIDGCSRNDFVVVMDEFNAKVGRDNEGWTTMEGGSAIFLYLKQMAWSSQEHCFSTKTFTGLHGSHQTGE